MLNATIYGLKP